MKDRALWIRNRQRRWKVDAARLKGFVRGLLDQDFQLESWELGIHMIGTRMMAGLNQRWLGHPGSTDILTFDHGSEPGRRVHGELYISVTDAVIQAAEFRTTPSLELMRYAVHGILHLQGYDDLQPGPRRRMKREEDRLVRRLAARFDPVDLVRPPG